MSLVTFFGEDLNNNPVARIAHPLADAARAAFLSHLSGVSTETFDALTPGASTPLPIAFTGAGTATLNGTGLVVSQPTGTNGFGRYPISGNNFWSANAAGADFSIAFDTPIAAFGFYGVDVGDFGGVLSLTLLKSGGGSVVVAIPHTVGVDLGGGLGSTDGSVIFFGFYDLEQTYTGILFDNPSIADVFAFDSFTIGSLVQVIRPPVVPVALPAAPLTPCTPRSEVSNGGKGKSGCNNGGVGGGSTYTGPYGSVPNHADPADGEALTGQDREPLEVWVDIVHEPYPGGSPSNADTFHFAGVDLAHDPDYEGGRKRAGLLTLGEIEHALGNERGGSEAGSLDLVLSQIPSREILNRLADEEFSGDQIRVKLATDRGQRNQVAPMILARQVIESIVVESGKRVRISAVDQLYAEDGPLGPKRRFPSWTFGAIEAIALAAPPDTLQQVIPTCYGPKSDENATDPITGVPRSKGLAPGRYCGKFQGVTGETTEPVLVLNAPEIDETLDTVPSGDMRDLGLEPDNGNPNNFIDTWNGEVRAVRAGKWGLPFQRTTSDPGLMRALVFGWNHDEPDADEYVVLVYNGPTPETSTIVRLQYHDTTTIDGDWNGDPTWRQFKLVFNSLLDGVDGLSLTTRPTEDEWGLIVFTLMPTFRYSGIFGSDLGELEAGKTRDRVELDLNNRADIMAPGYIWPFPDLFVRFTNTDGRAFDLGAIWVKGPLLEDHINGVVTITANIDGGYEDVGDGTGLPIVDAHDAEQHWYENFLLSNKTSGPWVTELTAPRWEDGTPMVNSSSFRARQVFTAAALGGRGLAVSWYKDAAESVPECRRQWFADTETKDGPSRHGQIKLFGIDETLDPTDWKRIVHERDIFGTWHRTSGDDRENVVRGACDWDPDAERLRGKPQRYQSDIAIEKFKGRIREGDLIESHILADPVQLSWVLQRRLARLGLGTTLIDVTGSRHWLDYDVGQGVLFNSLDGPGENGYVDHPFIILRRKTVFGPLRVVLTLWDVKDILIATAFENGLERLFYATDDDELAPLATDDEAWAPLAVL